MTTFFITCAALGGGILVLQLVLSALGVAHETAEHGSLVGAAESGLDLFSVRALSAGVAFFGIGGLAGLATGLGALVAVPLALFAGIAAAVAVALVMRAMLRLEDDGTVQIDGAVGVSGIVYLTVPAAREGAGKIHLALQNRTVELQAITTHDAPLPTGARILVIDVVGPDTVEVVPDPLLISSSEVSHAGA
jgi:hypothetical protein